MLRAKLQELFVLKIGVVEIIVSVDGRCEAYGAVLEEPGATTEIHLRCLGFFSSICFWKGS